MEYCKKNPFLAFIDFVNSTNQYKQINLRLKDNFLIAIP